MNLNDNDNVSNASISEDDFDKMQIDQLHKVVMNFSSQSTEIKKMCITVEVAALTLVTTVFKDSYSDSSFTNLVILILFSVPILFYGIDIYTYYYQDKLRASMYKHENEIRRRNGLRTLDENRFKTDKGRICRALKSYSNTIYWALLMIAFITSVIILCL